MTSLTTRQRDLLNLLLAADEPLITADIARHLQLTPRQVSYSLKGVQRWLSQRELILDLTPGVGVSLPLNNQQHIELAHQLQSNADYQLVLSASQRQQLFTFRLLAMDEPLILYQLQQLAQVSRSTIIKDLDSVEAYAKRFGIELERRPNYGVEFTGNEAQKRQALVALLWGDTLFGESVWQISHNKGLVFRLDVDSQLLPILAETRQLMAKFASEAATGQLAWAEAAIGSRFSDVAVLHLSLVFSVQAHRIGAGHFLDEPPKNFDWLVAHPIWSTAKQMLEMQDVQPDAFVRRNEVANVAAHLLCGARNDSWPSEFEDESDFSALISRLMHTVGSAYQLTNLSTDPTLRTGLMAHVIPACFLQQFGLWSPPQEANRLPDKYAFEHALAQTLAEIIADERGAVLPPHEVNNLALLIRAAYIRERPSRLQRVIVVCPSGMATAQLLTARIKARFPRLGNVEVWSLRELSEEVVDSAEVILTTIALDREIESRTHVIQVHPLLLPEDIEKITQWLA